MVTFSVCRSARGQFESHLVKEGCMLCCKDFGQCTDNVCGVNVISPYQVCLLCMAPYLMLQEPYGMHVPWLGLCPVGVGWAAVAVGVWEQVCGWAVVAVGVWEQVYGWAADGWWLLG